MVFGKESKPTTNIVTLVPYIFKLISFAPVVGFFFEVLYANAKNLWLFTFGVENLMGSVNYRSSLQHSETV